MFELRWKMKEYGGYALQYRTKYDYTIYAGLGPFPESHKQMVWSEWIDVPFVE